MFKIIFCTFFKRFCVFVAFFSLHQINAFTVRSLIKHPLAGTASALLAGGLYKAAHAAKNNKQNRWVFLRKHPLLTQIVCYGFAAYSTYTMYNYFFDKKSITITSPANLITPTKNLQSNFFSNLDNATFMSSDEGYRGNTLAPNSTNIVDYFNDQAKSAYEQGKEVQIRQLGVALSLLTQTAPIQKISKTKEPVLTELENCYKDNISRSFQANDYELAQNTFSNALTRIGRSGFFSSEKNFKEYMDYIQQSLDTAINFAQESLKKNDANKKKILQDIADLQQMKIQFSKYIFKEDKAKKIETPSYRVPLEKAITSKDLSQILETLESTINKILFNELRIENEQEFNNFMEFIKKAAENAQSMDTIQKYQKNKLQKIIEKADMLKGLVLKNGIEKFYQKSNSQNNEKPQELGQIQEKKLVKNGDSAFTSLYDFIDDIVKGKDIPDQLWRKFAKKSNINLVSGVRNFTLTPGELGKNKSAGCFWFTRTSLLGLAILMNNTTMLDQLLSGELFTKKEHKNNKHLTISLASDVGHSTTLGTPLTALELAVLLGNKAIVKKLLDYGCGIDLRHMVKLELTVTQTTKSIPLEDLITQSNVELFAQIFDNSTKYLQYLTDNDPRGEKGSDLRKELLRLVKEAQKL